MTEAWKRGEITLAAMCEAAGWTAPAPTEVEADEVDTPAEPTRGAEIWTWLAANVVDEPAEDEPADEHAEPVQAQVYTLSVVRGEQPDANGEQLGQSALEGVDLGAEIWTWLASNGVDAPGDDLTWVQVTPADENPGQLVGLVDQRDVTVTAQMVPPGLQGDEQRGRGRPEVGERVEVRLTPDMLWEVEIYAAGHDIPRARAIRQLVGLGLDAERERNEIRADLATRDSPSRSKMGGRST